MHEPISEVPNTKVKIITLSKAAKVKTNAVADESKIVAREHKMGTGVLKTKINIRRTAIKDTMEIVVISLDALDELSLE